MNDQYPRTEEVRLPCPVCRATVAFNVIHLMEDAVAAPVTLTCHECAASLVNEDEQRLVRFEDLDEEEAEPLHKAEEALDAYQRGEGDAIVLEGGIEAFPDLLRRLEDRLGDCESGEIPLSEIREALKDSS